MRSPWATVVIFIVCIMALLSFILFNLSGIGGPPVMRTKIVKCSNEFFDIAMMIDAQNNAFFVSGREIDQKHIKIFNDMAIEAEWPHKDG